VLHDITTRLHVHRRHNVKSFRLGDNAFIELELTLDSMDAAIPVCGMLVATSSLLEESNDASMTNVVDIEGLRKSLDLSSDCAEFCSVSWPEGRFSAAPAELEPCLVGTLHMVPCIVVACKYVVVWYFAREGSSDQSFV